MQKRLGYKEYKALSPIHLSNQKEVSSPLLTILFSPSSAMCLIDKIPFQKEEHLVTSNPEELYLCISMSFHFPETVGSLNLKNHLANSDIFILSRLMIPKPPWFLLRQI